MTCVISHGDLPISITWSLKGDIVSSGPTMTTTMLGTQASMLVISSVDYHHSGTYTCRAENPAGVTTYSAELKVNGNTHMGRRKYSIYIMFGEMSAIVISHVGLRSHVFPPLTVMLGM